MNPSTTSPRWATQGSQRRSCPISILAKQPHQIGSATLKEATALQRQPVVKQEYAAELDQAPQALLGAMIGCQYERIVGDAELENLRQARVVFRNGVELLLWDTEGGSAATE